MPEIYPTCVLRFIHLRLLISTATLSLMLCGCGGGEDAPPLGSVSGKVTHDGKPVTAGDVNFISDAGFAASAPIQEDGTYNVLSQYGTGLPVGEYLVSVTPPPPPESADPETPAPPPAPHPEIPEKYRSYESSGLKVMVDKEDVTLDIPMKAE